jgi:MFS family permease
MPSYFVNVLHFSGKDVALIFAGVTFIGMLAQPFWGQVADSSQKVVKVMRLCVLFSILPLLPLLWYRPFLLVMVCLWLLASCIAPMQSLLDTVTLSRFGMSGYGRIRVWGSLAYGASAMIFPAQYLDWAIAASLLCLVLGLLALLALKEDDKPRAPQTQQIFFVELMKNRAFVLLLLFGVVHWCSHAPYHMILDIHRRNMLLGHHVTGYAVAAGIIGECFLIALSPRWLRLASPRFWIIVAAALSALRWAVMGHAVPAGVFIVVQVLHGFTYGVFFVSCLSYLTEIIPPHMFASGQTVFSGVVFGGGTIIGSIYTGVGLDCEGNGFLVFNIASAVATLALVLSLWMPPYRKRISLDKGGEDNG